MSSFLDKKGFLYAVPLCEWGKVVSVSDEEPYSTIFASLKHPIRRRILRMLSKKPMSFSEMLGVLGVSSSFLTYHLENLGELVSKIDDGKYRLSSFGEAAMATMTKVEDIPTTVPQQSPETKPKRVVGRSVAIALGMICILLIAGLGGAIAYYTMTINQLNATIAPKLIGINLIATDDNPNYTIFSMPFNITSTPFYYSIHELNGTITTELNGTITSTPFNYSIFFIPFEPNGTITELNGTITTELNGTITSTPFNYSIFFPFEPNGTMTIFYDTPSSCLLVSGYVHNVGISTAYNCKIHVVAYQSGRVLAINTDIALGTISGQSQISVNASITYDGSPLIDWTLTPQWTTSP